MIAHAFNPNPHRLGPVAMAQKEVRTQRLWIDEHGCDLDGYCERYGTAQRPKHGTLGGPAIYAADLDYLRYLEAERDRVARGAHGR